MGTTRLVEIHGNDAQREIHGNDTQITPLDFLGCFPGSYSSWDYPWNMHGCWREGRHGEDTAKTPGNGEARYGENTIQEKYKGIP